ncbi:DUF4333 domain-containing protein [Saccharopolyspora gregorii]|uniref:DUF4333 domain-containing protein n=1 Tax=Saccharopolyspora gregorii TaxID=33914 RepID=UPI0021AC22F2|nr:DUF4333 domain-containing protein [Saccharopolyspora gregorii]
MSGPNGPSQQGGRPAQGHPGSAAGAGQRTNPGLPVPGRRPGRPGQGRTGQGGAEQQGRATQPGQTQPGHTQPGHTQPGQAQPGHTQPGQAQPGQAQSGQTQPGQTQQTQTQPGLSHPGQAQPGHSHPGRTQQTGQHPPRPDQQSRPRQGESGAQQPGPDRRPGAANPGQQHRTGDAGGRPRATGAESTHPNLPPIVVGPPGRGSAPPPAPRTRSKVPWVFGGAVLVTVAGSLAVVGFVHPGVLVHDRFDPESVQQGVAQTLRDSYHLGTVESVSCPAEQQVVPGNRFDCQVTLGGGTKPVSVTVRDASGTYEVGYPR